MAIGKRTFQSAGQLSQHLIPGAYSRIESVKGASGLVSANNLVILGRSTGGKPTTLLQFNKLSDAVDVLKGGDLMEAARLAFSPGGGYVPQKIFAMRVNNALQSSHTLVDGSANDMIKISSRDYGLQQNQLNILMGAGTNNGKKITIGFKENSEVFDDVYRASLTITHATDTLTIVNNSSAQTLTLVSAALTIDLNAYPTIGDVAAYINAQTGFTAVVTSGEENASSLELDAVSGQSLSGGYVAQSTFQAILDTLNTSSLYVLAEAVNAAEDRVVPENVSSVTYFTSGSEGSYTSTEWAAALTALEAEDIQFIATPDSTAANHALIKTHCESMSSVTGRKERQFVVGGAWGATSATAISAAQTLNSKYGMYVFNGGTQYNVSGVITNYAASFIGCMIAAIKTVVATNMPLTFKQLNLLSLENKLKDSTLEQCIQYGVAPVAYSPENTPWVVRQVNTYQTDDLKWNEFSMVTIMNFVSRDLRNFVESRYVGKPSTGFSLSSLKTQIIGRLTRYTELGLFVSDGEKAFWNVSLTLNGDTVTVDYDAYITAPVNFIFITNHFHEVSAAA
jgi:hypothetical protein